MNAPTAAPADASTSPGALTNSSTVFDAPGIDPGASSLASIEEGKGQLPTYMSRLFSRGGAAGVASRGGAAGVVASRRGAVGGALGIGVALAIALVWLLAFGGVRAEAKTIYSDTGSFGAAGELSYLPTKAVVDQATGNVLVVDSVNGQVDVFAPEGVSGALLTSFGAGELAAPYGIAIDQATHEVYVSDAGNNRIVRYTTDGAAKPTYTLDGSYSGPAAGAEGDTGQIGSFSAALAVDPANGDLLVADPGNNVVSRFDSSGAFVKSFDGAGAEGGAFHDPIDLTVGGGGDVYVVDLEGILDSYNNYILGSTRVLRFSSAGVARETIGSPATLGTVRSIAYDPAEDYVDVATQGYFAASTLHVLHEGAQAFELSYGGVFVGAAGLAAAGDGSGRVYAVAPLLYGLSSVQVLDRVVLPDVTLEPVSAVTATSAHFSGTVNPLGVNGAEYHFEYSSDGSSWASTPSHEAGGGSSPVTVEEDVPGLEPNLTYQVRLAAANANGANVSATASFTTSVALPAVTTDAATDIGPEGATLRGTIDARGAQSRYYFEYGPSAAYGSRSPESYELSAGNARVVRHFARGVEGLQAGSTYHFRLVAKDSAGTSYGPDRTFTTAPAGETSAYELVSPAEKGGSGVNPYVGYQANFDGSVFGYMSQTPLGDETESSPFYIRYVAKRDAGAGWTSRATDPPMDLASGNALIAVTLGVSEDGTKAVVISTRKLAPGAVEGDSNTYLRDVATGSYTTIATVPGNEYYVRQATYTWDDEFVYGTSDFSHIELYGDVPLLPGAPDGADYDYTGGQLKLVSKAPAGTPMGGGTFVPRERHDQHLISEDGSKIFFSGEGAVYMRLDDASTVAISASQRAEDLGTVKPGTLLGASADGRVVFILSQGLTEDSEPGVETLYRYDTQTHQLELLAAVPGGIWKLLQVSANGQSVYFEAVKALAPGGVPGATNTYVWRAGQIRLVVTSDPTREGGGLLEWQPSPDGRYFAFTAWTQLTEYDNSSPSCPGSAEADPNGFCSEVYRYDADTGTVTCASCRRDGGRGTGHARIGYLFEENGGHHFPRVMFDDGRVFFETPDRLSARDVDSVSDVYSFDGSSATLLSSGRGSGSFLGDVSGDERNVFFVTQDKLVSSDTDRLMDVYDLRVGGGIAGQNPEPPRSECSGESCLGAGLPPAAPPSAGSVVFDGPGNIPADGGAAPKARATAKGDRIVKGPVFTLSVTAVHRARISIAGADVRSVSRTVGKAGSYRLRVELTAKGRRELRRKGSLRLRLRVRVAYAGGKSSRASVLVTVKA